MSLRECALHDCMLYHGIAKVTELKEKLRQRKYYRRRGRKTNVGDPNSNGNNVRKAKK